MKKITLIAVLFALFWQASAENLERRNELKICPAHLLAGSLRIEYERLLNDFSSVGLTGLYSFSSLSSHRYDSRLEGQVLGFYRLYFGRRDPASGFFLEGNMGVTMGSHYHWRGGSWGSERVHYTSFGIGLALGWKWYIQRPGIVLDIFAGGGRLFNDDNRRASGFPRVGVTIGRRF